MQGGRVDDVDTLEKSQRPATGLIVDGHQYLHHGFPANAEFLVMEVVADREQVGLTGQLALQRLVLRRGRLGQLAVLPIIDFDDDEMLAGECPCALLEQRPVGGAGAFEQRQILQSELLRFALGQRDHPIVDIFALDDIQDGTDDGGDEQPRQQQSAGDNKMDVGHGWPGPSLERARRGAMRTHGAAPQPASRPYSPPRPQARRAHAPRSRDCTRTSLAACHL
ncbi:hypothetical protein D3C78_1173320 [compost metagenome]